jgi:type II secretory pathway pseudopilin PulG
MKLTNTLTMKRKAGMTLLELTVVILVLLSLISILFIGARAWKKGSDRAANILNIRNVQQAVRAHANVRGLLDGATLASTDIIGTGKYLNTVTPPNSDITYTGNFAGTVPAMGTLYLSPAYANATATADYAPTAASYSEW